MYKQHNNGPGISVRLGLAYWQDDGKDASPDVLFYHHQGNLVEWLYPNNVTRWMQLSFNEKYGLMYFVMPTPALPDVIRWNKECFFWCGSVSPENGNPLRWRDWLESKRGVNYNGWWLNCLEFSQGLFDFFAPDNQGCMPKHLVDKGERIVGNNPAPPGEPAYD